MQGSRMSTTRGASTPGKPAVMTPARPNKAKAAIDVSNDRCLYKLLDFSFLNLPNIEALLTEDPRDGTPAPSPAPSAAAEASAPVVPQRKVGGQLEEPRPIKRYYAHSIRLQNNDISTMTPLPDVLSQILVGFGTPPPPSPLGLITWIDLSFNKITELDETALVALPNLRTLNLHSNQIADFRELFKLRLLTVLHTVTLHGNPVEQLQNYRVFAVAALPATVRKLDFSLVSMQERDCAGSWAGIHGLQGNTVDLRRLEPAMQQRRAKDDPLQQQQLQRKVWQSWLLCARN